MSDNTEITPGSLVTSFYHDVWNECDEQLAHKILAADFRFRGSIGLEKVGVDGFVEYMQSIHTSLRNYTCVIENLIIENENVAAKMTFKGLHVATFLGVAATYREISWAGAAFFTFRHNQIASLWVLGDVDSILRQLTATANELLE
jgi:steroid delta-isomerase-like uncharacterized protein